MKPNVQVSASRKGTAVMSGLVRLAFVNILVAKPNPSGALKYSTTILIAKDDPQVEVFKEAIKQAAIDKWADKIPKGLRNPLRDGDDKEYSGFSGHYFISCNSDSKPGVVDAMAKPITEESVVYSGCWARVDVNLYGYMRAGNQGVACGLNNVQKIADDDAFTGRQAADKVFGAVVSADNPFEAKEDKKVDADVDNLFA